jgi:hypothetical protein
MANVKDAVDDFERRVKAGERPRVRLKKKYVEPFLGELVRRGARLPDEYFDGIRDPDLREIIRTVLYSGADGALLGATVGALLGPKGAAVGAAVGAGIGVAVAIFALVITYREEYGPGGADLIVEAAAA